MARMGEQNVDQLLVERVQRGDKKAIAILVAKYRHKIVKLISRYEHDLSEVWGTAITLRELEGLSYEDIAEAMGCPIGTVRSRIFRAREAIHNRLKPLLTCSVRLQRLCFKERGRDYG